MSKVNKKLARKPKPSSHLKMRFTTPAYLGDFRIPADEAQMKLMKVIQLPPAEADEARINFDRVAAFGNPYQGLPGKKL